MGRACFDHTFTDVLLRLVRTRPHIAAPRCGPTCHLLAREAVFSLACHNGYFHQQACHKKYSFFSVPKQILYRKHVHPILRFSMLHYNTQFFSSFNTLPAKYRFFFSPRRLAKKPPACWPTSSQTARTSKSWPATRTPSGSCPEN